AALAVIWLAMLLWGGGALDRSVYLMLYAGHRPALAAAAHLVTFLGEPDVLVVASIIAAIALRYAGHRHLSWVFLGISLVGRGLAEVQKYWIARVRPDVEPHLVVVKTSSFPSGHATNSMIFYLMLAMVATMGTRWH